MIVTLATEHRTRLNGWLTTNNRKTAAVTGCGFLFFALCCATRNWCRTTAQKKARTGRAENYQEQPNN
ncbi:hypothetical protein RNAN_0671 [Rheinheimera nanhaiensis E407-8]|uniref:Uncharacterized protein n=1 Tax=Rheinheimera nanhaiensis E407-8 TaxID=562729 RepID=I1DUH4_9GAMM|nr:hypothetical protein RNAN_0671 [Rheinheimera nanhaiensis E407-8]